MREPRQEHWVRQNEAIPLEGQLPIQPPLSLFPPRPDDPFEPSDKMRAALQSAVAAAETALRLPPGTFPVRFTIAEITDASGSFPSAGHQETVTDYIASEAKVMVMYAAYALRDLVRRFAVGRSVFGRDVLTQIASQLNPSIAAASRNVARSPVMDRHRIPSYRDVVALTPGDGWGFRVGFTRDYDRALEAMIVPSNNVAASTCVHGVGYGYLNGCLAAAGVFDPGTDQGLWVAGDFREGKVWPAVRILSRNDNFVAQAGTTRDMARLVALIMTDRILDPATCGEMRARLARAARGVDTPWVDRVGVFRVGVITHNKIGLGELKSRRDVRSEVSVYQAPVAPRRRYVVAWQNLIGMFPAGLVQVAKIIKATITAFER